MGVSWTGGDTMRKYSDSGGDDPPVVLALDTSSPVNSLAVGQGTRLLGTTSFPGGPSTPPVLASISQLLDSVDLRPEALGRLVGLSGPGSFTGLRSGLATLLGMHQALGIPAAALPTFLALAHQAENRTIVAAVNALRGEWYVQAFQGGSGEPTARPCIVTPERLRDWAPCTVVAFGSEELRAAAGTPNGIEFRESAALAPILLDVATKHEIDWNPGTLTAPLYLRPPAASSAPRPQVGL